MRKPRITASDVGCVRVHNGLYDVGLRRSTRCSRRSLPSWRCSTATFMMQRRRRARASGLCLLPRKEPLATWEPTTTASHRPGHRKRTQNLRGSCRRRRRRQQRLSDEVLRSLGGTPPASRRTNRHLSLPRPLRKMAAVDCPVMQDRRRATAQPDGRESTRPSALRSYLL